MSTPAVAYYRMSSDKQETSIADQRSEVEAYARKNGYRLVGEYSDEGISGWKTNQRKGFTKLISDAETGRFKAILCWDIDRFSRFDPLEANHYWYLLDKSGVQLVTVAQGAIDWHDLGGWLSASVVQHGKAQYVKDLARNTARGIRERKLSGRWFGPAPYGYRFADGKLELGDLGAIAVVRRIFDMRARGFELIMIARQLNNEGIPTPRGSEWRTVHVSTILEREAYIGATVIGRHSSAKFCKTTEEPILVPDTHPAIIDKATWDRVRAIPKFIRRGNGRGGSNGARLSGLLTCGRCGGPMYSVSVTGGNHYYLCGNYNPGSRTKAVKCDYCRVAREDFERALFRLIRDKVLLGSRDRLEAKIAEILAEKGRGRRSSTAGVAKRQLAKLDSQIEQATGQLLLIDPDLLPGAQERLRTMRNEREALAAKIDATTEKPLPSAREIASRAWELPDILQKADPALARVTLQQIVEGVTLNFEHDLERSTAKRKRMKFVGGEVRLHSEDAAILGR